jgi:hypothetical protein
MIQATESFPSLEKMERHHPFFLLINNYLFRPQFPTVAELSSVSDLMQRISLLRRVQFL